MREIYRRSSRTGAWEWLFQRVTGVLLVVALMGHYWVTHYFPGGHVTFEKVNARFMAAGTAWKIVVEPLPSIPVIKDLVTDFAQFFEMYRVIKPYLITNSPSPERERLQSPEDRKLLDGAYECILCGACTTSCPSFWADKAYLGPAALLKAYRWSSTPGTRRPTKGWRP